MDPAAKLFYGVMVACILLGLAHCAWGHEHALHWLNQYPYKDATTGKYCCWHKSDNASLNHCHEIPYKPKVGKDGYILRSGEVVPWTRVKVSRDENFYECRDDHDELLCFFAPPSGS
jgi:hypothetical protein